MVSPGLGANLFARLQAMEINLFVGKKYDDERPRSPRTTSSRGHQGLGANLFARLQAMEINLFVGKNMTMNVSGHLERPVPGAIKADENKNKCSQGP